MTSCQLARPRARYVTACNNMADRNPLQAAAVSTGSHPEGEKREPVSLLSDTGNTMSTLLCGNERRRFSGLTVMAAFTCPSHVRE